MQSFEEILRIHNVPRAPHGHQHSRPGWVNIDCPDCTPNSRRWRLGFNLRHRYFSCWACGYREPTGTIAAVAGISRAQAREILEGMPSDRTRYEGPVRGKLVIPPGVTDLLPCHRDYLWGRGFDPDALVALWGLRGIGMAVRLAWRVWIPYHHNGEVVSWLTRGITDHARHRSAEASEEVLDHKTLLYGADHARHAVAIVEGATDTWAIGPGAVGLCGIGYKREQVVRLAEYPIRVVCFNTERSAQNRAKKLCRELSVFPGETHNLTFTFKDAAETMTKKPEELDYVRKEFLGYS